MEAALTNVFLKILNMSITATYVMLFICILRLIFRKMPKIISYALWFVVLFRLVCPVSFSSAYSMLNAFKELDIPASQNGFAFIPENINLLTPAQNNFLQATGIVSESLPPVGQHIPDVSWVPYAATVLWLSGIMILVMYLIISCLRQKKRLADATLIEGQVFKTDAVSSPFIFGFIQPRIYLPVGISAEDSAYVLRHEQSHIRRLDFLVKPFAFLVLTVHWFNPLIWLAYCLMSLDMEMSCDEKVVKDLGQTARSEYSNTLLRLSLHRKILTGSPLAFGESGTESRIRNILNYRKPGFWIALVSVAVVVIAGVCLLANPISERLTPEKSIDNSTQQTKDSQTTQNGTSSVAETSQTVGPTTSQDGEPDFPFIAPDFQFDGLSGDQYVYSHVTEADFSAYIDQLVADGFYVQDREDVYPSYLLQKDHIFIQIYMQSIEKERAAISYIEGMPETRPGTLSREQARLIIGDDRPLMEFFIPDLFENTGAQLFYVMPRKNSEVYHPIKYVVMNQKIFPLIETPYNEYVVCDVDHDGQCEMLYLIPGGTSGLLTYGLVALGFDHGNIQSKYEGRFLLEEIITFKRLSATDVYLYSAGFAGNRLVPIEELYKIGVEEGKFVLID